MPQPQIAGGKLGSVRAAKKAAEKKSGDFIKYVQNGMTVRFIEEPDEWFGFYEHYDETLRRYYPCTDEGCPGCSQDERKTFRFLANALDLEDKKVVALKLPKDLGNRLVVRYEKYHTLMDRDYELLKSGTGLDTTYDVEAGEKKARKLTSFKPLDLSKVLLDAYNSVWGEDDDDEDDEPVAKKRRKPAPKPKDTADEVAVDDDDDEWDDDDGLEEADDHDPTDDDEEFDDDEAEGVEDDDDDDDDDEEESTTDDDNEWWSESELKAQSLSDLRNLARDYGITVRKNMKKADLVAAILEEGE